MDAETPPRTWGGAARCGLFSWCKGNTPTNVGRRTSKNLNNVLIWKHPHERGEELDPRQANLYRKETPPRTWGGASLSSPWPKPVGNTPTNVGRSSRARQRSLSREKHPHERGEERRPLDQPMDVRETPPRTWGGGLPDHHHVPPLGNTPTNVGRRWVAKARLYPQSRFSSHEKITIFFS